MIMNKPLRGQDMWRHFDFPAREWGTPYCFLTLIHKAVTCTVNQEADVLSQDMSTGQNDELPWMPDLSLKYSDSVMWQQQYVLRVLNNAQGNCQRTQAIHWSSQVRDWQIAVRLKNWSYWPSYSEWGFEICLDFSGYCVWPTSSFPLPRKPDHHH